MDNVRQLSNMGPIKKVQFRFGLDCQLSHKENFFRGANVRFEDFDARGFRVSGFVVEIGDDVGVVHSNNSTCRSGHGGNHLHHYQHHHNHFCFVSGNNSPLRSSLYFQLEPEMRAL